MHKKFYSSHWFLKNQVFSFFPIVKVNANYAEICRLGGGRFSTSSACSVFLKFSQYFCETSVIQIQQTKVKKYFRRQKLKKDLFTIEIVYV